MNPISIQLYTVRNDIAERGLQPVLEDIAKIGYPAVEGGGNDTLSHRDFRTMVEDLGMRVSSTWGDVATVDGAKKLVEACQELGTTYAAGGFWLDAFESVDAISRTADLLNTSLPILSDAGITFGLHNHWFEFEMRDGRLAIENLVELVPSLKLELDIYWCSNFRANEPVEMVRQFSDRVALMHVKDGSQVRDEPMTAVGQGSIDVPACLAGAKPAWWIVELDEFDGNMMDAVRDSFTYLSSL